MKQLAQTLAKRGWRVFPVSGKRPLVKDWPTEASSKFLDVNKLWKRFPDANVGIACGVESGIVVVDLDGQTGVDSWEALTAFEECPETYTVVTGSGGLHLYFAHPGFAIKNSVSKLGPNVDVRSDGGFVVSAGSKHPNGNDYLVKHDVEVAACPLWLVKKLDEAPLRNAKSDLDEVRGETGILSSDGPVADLLRGNVEVGRRNATFHGFFTWTAWTVHLPMELAWEWWQQLNEKLPTPEEDFEEVEGTMKSAYSSAPPEKGKPNRQWQAPKPADEKKDDYLSVPKHERLARKLAQKEGK